MDVSNHDITDKGYAADDQKHNRPYKISRIAFREYASCVIGHEIMIDKIVTTLLYHSLHKLAVIRVLATVMLP